MAIKIHIDGTLSSNRPLSSDKYTLDEIAVELDVQKEHVKIEDMGPFILAHSFAGSTVNSIASIYFRYPIFGNTLLIAGNELSIEEHLTEENTKYEVYDVEAGILKSIKDTMSIYQMVIGEETGSKTTQKTVYYYDPSINNEKMDATEIEFTIDFYKSAYDVIKKHNEMPNGLKLADLTLLEEQDLVVKFPPDEKKIVDIIEKMVNYFVSVEEYEKCGFLKKALKESREQQNLI